MVCMRLPAVVLVAACACMVTARGKEDSAADLTADELMIRADSARNEKRFGEAAKLYQRFIDDFGQTNEKPIQELIRRRRYDLAICYLKEKQFSAALPAVEAALALNPPLEQRQQQELQFWLGVCQMQEKEYEAARASLEKFLGMFTATNLANPRYLEDFPAAKNLDEARLLIGTALILEEKFAEAAAFLAGVKDRMNAMDRGRATVLELYALMQAGDRDAALVLVRGESSRSGEFLQVVAFQTLVLQLGGTFLEEGRLRDGIDCLQQVWSRDRLLKHQRARLEDLESRLAAAQLKGDTALEVSLSQQANKVKREIGTFAKIENFDSALRLRLARAYQLMGRHREAALIMEQMLAQMPPDPLVEQASVSLVQSWNAIERWPKVVEAAEEFGKVFPSSKSLPLVLYLAGIANQRALDYPAAIARFDEILASHPKSEYAARARFMKGFTQLLAEENAAAIKTFDTFRKDHSKHELADANAYWRAMAHSLDKRFEEARAELDAYLNAFPDGRYRAEAVFRRAYCAQQMEDYETSIAELGAFLRNFPGAEQASEAKILLGDALMNEGRMEEGIAAFAAIDPADTRFYEEGVFKTAKALKLMEEPDRLRTLMEDFVAGHPGSPRVAEALFNIGWIHRQAGDPAKARDIYWEAIGEYGNDPLIWSVDDLFPALARLYRGPEEQAQYLARLRDLREEADGANQTVLAMRALWAQGDALRRTDPERSREILVEAAARADVRSVNPKLLADFADAMLASGRESEGELMWRDLVKWNPRAPQKDRAFAALGLLELSRGNERAALNLFDRFERETLGSALLGRIMLARAGLLADRGDYDGARKSLETLLASPFSGGQEKAEALYAIGEIHMRQNKPALAIPYYQRIYVMHGRWKEWVARAYLRSGEAFEKLGDTLSARRTYQELDERGEFTDFAETSRARSRLQELGGPLPPETPTPEPAG